MSAPMFEQVNGSALQGLKGPDCQNMDSKWTTLPELGTPSLKTWAHYTKS
jgi:hypothetical protein